MSQPTVTATRADICAVCSEPATVTTTFGERSCGHPACLVHHHSRRRFKFDKGDWVALRVRDQWRLVGKAVDADSESVTVQRRDGTRAHFAVDEDPIVRAYWRGRRWYIR